MTNELQGESLGHWAKRCGISYRTAWRWFHARKMPKGVEAEQMPTGTILVRDKRHAFEVLKMPKAAVIYARINPRQSHATLHQQIESCRAFCLGRGWTIEKVVREIAPGVGPQRVKLARLIRERTPRVVIATTSVLSRFDFRFYEALWQGLDLELVVVDRSDETAGRGGALEDLTDAINITCHRHYGPKRGHALVEILSRVISGSLSV